MSRQPPDTYLSPSSDAGRAFAARGIEGPVVMLNLLRFRACADYAASPELAPDDEISGAEAYRRYIEHTTPHLKAAGAELLLLGRAEAFLIGPPDETWDAALVVRHASAAAFLAFASNSAYLATVGHRTAALADSRLLPLVEGSLSDVIAPRS